MEQDTIAAIATALNHSGISIVRISGEKALEVAGRIFFNQKREKILKQPKSHTVHYGYIYDGQDLIDEVLVVYMKAPRSYTAEDVVEVDCHGGLKVTERVLQTVLKNGARLAEPGEFTKRAFLNGRIDLTEAEAVMDLIQSKNEFSMKNSLNQMQGSIRKKIEQVRARLLHEIAYLEAALDDPEHYELVGYGEQLDQKLDCFLQEGKKILKNSKNGALLKDGICTVIVGKPNVGKSSILNLLVGKERAIVTEIEGTTRDILEEQVVLQDIVLRIIDTAGIRETEDRVEKIGVERSKKSVEEAQLVLFVLDWSKPLTKEDREIFKLIQNQKKKAVILLNKTDLETEHPLKEEEVRNEFKFPVLSFSAKEEQGTEELAAYIRDAFFEGDLHTEEEIYLTNLRQQQLVEEAISSMELVKQSIAQGMPEDFYTIDLTRAYEALGRMIGEEVDDDVVDEIFRAFCMGK